VLKGQPFVCPTTQVCVQQCPNKTSYYTFQSYSQYRVCTDDVAITNTDNKKLVDDGKCAPYIIASTPIFGRCIPEQIESLTNTIIQVGYMSQSNEENIDYFFLRRQRMIMVSMRLFMILVDNR
jgi:hypothetical protein